MEYVYRGWKINQMYKSMYKAVLLSNEDCIIISSLNRVKEIIDRISEQESGEE